MDAFTFIIVGGMALLIVALLLIGRFYPGTGADVLDWKPTRSIETEVELELDDTQQMLEAQNARRARRGLPPRTMDDVEGEVAAGMREHRARRDAYRAEHMTDEEDLRQLLEAKNERRRERGQPDLSVEEFRAQLDAEHRG